MTATERYNQLMQASYTARDRMKLAREAWDASDDDDTLFDAYMAARCEWRALVDAAEDAYALKLGGYAATIRKA